MIVTTSRDPSSKARRFARALASFLSLPYVNRGKQNLGGDDTWLVVIEDHGNPAGLVKRSSEEMEQLNFQLSGDTQARRLKKDVPKVAGEGTVALPIAQFFELEWLGEAIPAQGRIIRAASGNIEFMDEGQAEFRLKI
jgi:rRNA maturation protein Rpf1